MILFHPYLFASHQTLFLLSHNITETALSKALYPLLITLALTFAAVSFFSARSFDRSKTAAGLSFFWLMFFSYGPVEQYALSYAAFASGAWFFPLWLAFVYFAVKKITALPVDFNKAGTVLNFTAAALIIMPALNIAGHYYAVSVKINETPGGKYHTASMNSDEIKLSGRPDIYHIVLDGYARTDILKDIYGYDNSDFINYLKSKGFYVAEKSYANYATFTAHSVASYLNYDHYSNIFGDSYKDYRPLDKLTELIQRNAAAKFLRSYGYSFVSYYIIDGVIYTADILLKPDVFRRGAAGEIYFDPFYNMLINKTPLALLFKNFSKEFDFSLSEGIRALSSYMFESIKDMNGFKKPIFVYAHFPLPHPPFVFDENGGSFAGWKFFSNPFGDADVLVTGDRDRENYRKFYLNQLKYATLKTREMIEAIIKNSKEPPVIILQSDHGPGSNFSFNDPRAAGARGLRERYAILNAYYAGKATGEKNTPGLHQKVTPVNTYRIIFNALFGSNMPMLPDKCFYAPVNRPYDFCEIETD